MKNTARLRQRILSRAARIGVVGQGYVGVSLACAAAEAGFQVVGIDLDQRRVDGLAAGELVVPGVPERAFRAGVSTGRVRFTTEHAEIEDLDVVLICVATPVRDHTPDLSQVERACKEVASYLTPGKLVILESTTYPGTTDEVVKPALETSGLLCGHDFLLAYSPERIDPGNEEFRFRNTPQASSAASLRRRRAWPGSSTRRSWSRSPWCRRRRAAELAKLLENTFRACQHRSGQRDGDALPRDGHRRLGGDRRGCDEAVRLHDVPTGPRRRRPLHPAGPDVPRVAGAA